MLIVNSPWQLPLLLLTGFCDNTAMRRKNRNSLLTDKLSQHKGKSPAR